jgi:hypothetical protein
MPPNAVVHSPITLQPVCLHVLLPLPLQVLSHSQLQATLDTLSACQRLRRLCLTGPNKLHRWAAGYQPTGIAPVPCLQPCQANCDIHLGWACLCL